MTGRLNGKMLLTLVDLRFEAGEWVARSTPGSGEVEFRFHRVGSGPTDRAIAGSVSGEAYWASRTLPHQDLIVRLGSRASALVADGVARRLFSDGSMHGEIVFADSAGASATCPDVSWTMQPESPAPLLSGVITR